MNYRRLGVSYDIVKGSTYKLTISASCGLTSCKDVEFSKLVSLDKHTLLKFDTDALKQLNPTVTFTKRF